MPVGAFVSKSRRITRSSWRRVDSVEKSSSGTTLDGKTIDPCLLRTKAFTGPLLVRWDHAPDAALDGVDEAGPTDLVRALRRADEEAWLAVETPVEGTILSVTRAAALAADAAPDDVTVDDLVRAVAKEARAALQRTTSQLDVLAEAGVVDAGGAGIVVVLDALVAARAASAPAKDVEAAQALHRKAQWRLDFVAAENSMGFHAPQELARILGEIAQTLR